MNAIGARRFGLPWGVQLAAFSFWVFALLHQYYWVNPVDFRAVFSYLAPAFPAAQFEWEKFLALVARFVRGHVAIVLWVGALAGLGASALALVRTHGPGAAPARWFFRLGMGMAVGLTLWLGLGFAGLVFPVTAWVITAFGLIQTARLLHEFRAPETKEAGRWLLLGLGATVVLVLALSLSLAGWQLLAKMWEKGAAGVGVLLGILIIGAWGLAVSRRLGVGRGDWLVGLLTLELAAGVLLVAATSGVPERFYDAQVYHLACPSLFVMQHKVTGLPNLMHSSVPLGTQMLYTWQWLLAGEPAARAWRVWLIGLLLGCVWLMGRREGSPRAGLIAASLFGTLPILVTNACQTSVDLETCVAVLLACLALREARAGGARPNWLVLCALFTGTAFAMKYTAIFWAPWLAVLAAGAVLPPGLSVARPLSWLAVLRQRPGFWRRLALFAAIVFSLVLPWLARNWFVVGNPVYPYATEVFRAGRQWAPERHERFLKQQATYVVEKKGDLLRLPWLLSVGHTSETYIGPLILLMAPLLLLYFPAARAPALYGSVALLSFLLWVGVTHVHRFLLPTWALAGVVVAWMAEDFRSFRRVFSHALIGLMIILGAGNLGGMVLMWGPTFDAVNLLVGREAPEAYLDRRMLNSYSALARRADTFVPERGRIMIVGETRGLYWPRPFLNHSVYDIQVFEEIIRDSRDGTETAKRLRQRGVTHLFFGDVETSRMKNRFDYPMLNFSLREMHVIGQLWDTWMDFGLAGGPYTRLYALREVPRTTGVPPPRPLAFDNEAMKREFEGYTEISWQGGGDLKAVKTVEMDRRR